MTTPESASLTIDPLHHGRVASAKARRLRAVRLVGGGLLIGVGLSRRAWLGVPLAAYGLELVVEALTDRKLSAHLIKAWEELGTPSRRFGNGTRDRVDEASWESFPASDPSGAI